MKKLTSLFLILFTASTFCLAQYGSKEQISAYRKIQSIERDIVSEGTDEEAATLIKEHRKAKKVMEKKMMLLDGYGKAAKTKPALNKFRAKQEKSNPDFAKLSREEKTTRKKKETYLIGINEDYKRLLPIASPKR